MSLAHSLQCKCATSRSVPPNLIDGDSLWECRTTHARKEFSRGLLSLVSWVRFKSKQLKNKDHVIQYNENQNDNVYVKLTSTLLH